MIRNVTLLLDDMSAGGAARVAANLSTGLVAMGRHVTLLTTEDGSRPTHYPLPSSVVHIPLSLRGTSRNPLEAAAANLGRLRKLRRAILASRPDVLISFLDTTNVKCLLATRGLGIPILVSERTDPHGRPIGRAWEWLRRLTYPWAQAVVTQSLHALQFFPPSIQAKGRVIPNPVVAPDGRAAPGQPGRYQVVTLGSLRKVKGHALLIDAFARIASGAPDWDLVIHGEGPERKALETQVEALGLAGRVQLPGQTPEPGARLREGALFVLSSFTEGFPNALAEAMACGLPAISFDCASGPAELIRPGVDGILVTPGDTEGLASALASLIGNPQERARLSANAPDVLDRFSLEKVMALWEEAIQGAVTPG